MVVIGNCQAEGIARCLRLLSPRHDVSHFTWRQVVSGLESGSLATVLDAADMIVRQAMPGDAVLQVGALKPGPRLLRIPRIAFTGLHPDWIRLDGKDAQPNLGANASAIVAAAFQLGLPEERVPGLFNAYVFNALGYFDEYAKAAAFLNGQRTDIAPRLQEWERLGAFLHLPNHPVIEVVWSIALDICERIGLRPDRADIPADPLRQFAIWPVYPEIARRLGFEGSLVFKGPDPSRPIGLEEMIDETYRTLDRLRPPHSFRSQRVDGVVQIFEREGLMSNV
jgi:hypothetical protein